MTTCGPSHVQVDKTGLHARFCKASRWVEPTKISSAILPAHQAFDYFAKWNSVHGKVPQFHEFFQPHNRGFVVSLKKEEFCGHLRSLIGKNAPPLSISKKLEWDEAVSPFLCLPAEDSVLAFPEPFDTGVGHPTSHTTWWVPF